MRNRSFALSLLVLVASMILAACGGNAGTTAPAATTAPDAGAAPTTAIAAEPTAAMAEPTTAAAEPTAAMAEPTAAPAAGGAGNAATLTLWAPNAEKCDPKEEWGTVACIVDDFNKANPDTQVTLKSAPIDGWTNYVNSGALAGDLPDVLYFDGPTLANFAWAGYLQPVDQFLTDDLKKDFLPSVAQQNTYNGKTYAVSAFDGGFGIWANKDYLTQAGVRIPTSVADAWTRQEFEDALAKLQKVPGVSYAMDMKMNYGQGEWFTYGFSPILQSLGGDLIDRDTLKAAGTLDGPKSVEAMTLYQSWIKNGYVNAEPAGDTDFDEGKTALSWVGHWQYGRYKEALGDKLVAIPMPKLGDKAVTGLGSWALAMSAKSANPEAAWKLMQYMIDPAQITRLTTVNGAVPSRLSALEQSPTYKDGGPLHVLVEQLQEIAVARPVTPAYPVITKSFAEAVNNIAKGADVQEELTTAAQAIDQDIADNNGYAPKQ